MKSFEGKVAAITGAGSGLGRALALELAGQGCALALSDMAPEGLAQTRSLAEAAGARCSTARVDVADRAAMQAWAAAVVREHGRVNLVFNNAGVSLVASAEATTQADFDWIMGVNFWGVVHGTQAFLPHLRASGDGHIVNISSVFGLIAMPTQSAYNASKFAVRGYTEALRMELDLERAPIGVTCVHPGGVATNIVTAQRVDASVARMTGMDPDVHHALSQKVIQRTSPQAAARQVLRGVRRNARRVLIGGDARFADALSRLLGAGYQVLMTAGARQMHRVGKKR